MKIDELEIFLKEYNYINCKIRNIQLELDEFENTIISGVDVSKDSIKSGYVSSTVEKNVIRKQNLERELEYLKLMDKKIKNVKECLTEREKSIFNIFTNVCTNGDIAIKYNVTEQTVCYWKKNLLKKINKLGYF